MTFRFTIFSLLLCLLLISAPAKAEPVSKDELGGLIREYLLENPEVIAEAVEQLQKKVEEESTKSTRAAIAKHHDKIYNNPHVGMIGNKDAKITIVEFFDYNCSACKYMFAPLDKLRQDKDRMKDIRVLFFEYPIFGEKSEKLARIGLAVHTLKPEAYYEFHSLMMQHKGALDVQQAYEYAAKAGVSRETLERELTSSQYSDILKAHAALGADLGIRGTPFLIIGDEPVPHALDEAGLESYIKQAEQGR